MEKHTLVKRAINGNKKALQELILEEKNKLFRIAYLYVKNEQDALDIVQETVYKSYISINKLREPNYFSTWLTKILINNALDFIKKSKKEFPGSIENIEIAGQKMDTQIEEELDLINVIDKLETRFKTVIILRFYEDFTIKQIANTLNSPEGTIKTQLHRALNKLKIYLKEDFAK